MSVSSLKILLIIGGSAGHGKDTLARMVQEIITPWTEVHTTSYAYGIKKILHDNYGTPWEILEGVKDVKENSFIYIGNQKTDLTVRRALQKIGQFHRETFGATCWAASALTRCQQSNARVSIITDARHPAEEIHWIGAQAQAAGFMPIPIRVRRSCVPVIADHPSESLILAEPDSSFPLLVENEGSLEDLRKMAEQVACAAVILQKTGKKKLKRSGGCVVRDTTGRLPWEPQLSEEDAEVLVGSAAVFDPQRGPLAFETCEFDLLKGTALGS
jgi:hypothetical protein